MKWVLALCATGSVFGDDVLDQGLPLDTELVAMGKRTTDKSKAKMVVQPVIPQYDNRFGFAPDRLVYERTKNDAFYFGLDLWGGLIFNGNRHHRNNWYGRLWEGEVRFGYNLFYNQRDHFSPFVGGGYLYNNVGSFHKAQFAYEALGFIYTHDFNSTFSLGFNLKGLAGQQVSNHYAKKFAWGGDVSVPFIFHLANSHWDISFEPYYLYMSFPEHHQGVVGSRGAFNYHF